MKCHCCSSEMYVIGEFNGFKHARCDACQFEHFFVPQGYVSNEMYEQDQDYKDDLDLASNHRALLQWAHKKALRLIKGAFSSTPGDIRILDIGCFNGFFVKELVLRGYDAYGIDFNSDAIGYGERYYGLQGRLKCQKIQDVELSGERFDVVTMFEVVEHLPDTSELFTAVSRILKPGGLVVVSTPNSKMCWRPPLDFPPHHLSRFSPRSLNSLLIRSGFTPVRSYEQMSLYDLLRHRVGLFFRSSGGSLRGGDFASRRTSIALRKVANMCRGLSNFFLVPVNQLAYAAGFRYISQVVAAKL